MNFYHLVRDINGKYSFTVQPRTDGRETRIELKCTVKGVSIRLPLKALC